MMCRQCTLGGDAAVKSRDPAKKTKLRKSWAQAAFMRHAQCEAPATCTCSHRVMV
jgi:hypothetical protein